MLVIGSLCLTLRALQLSVLCVYIRRLSFIEMKLKGSANSWPTREFLSKMPRFSASALTRSFASDSLLAQRKPLLSVHVSAEVSKLLKQIKIY